MDATLPSVPAVIMLVGHWVQGVATRPYFFHTPLLLGSVVVLTPTTP
jgi:hypothetical protein